MVTGGYKQTIRLENQQTILVSQDYILIDGFLFESKNIGTKLNNVYQPLTSPEELFTP